MIEQIRENKLALVTTVVSVVKQQWRVLLTGVQFLTIVPVRIVPAPTPQEVGYSLSYYPLIGLLIGAVLWSSAHLFAGFSAELSAALMLVVWVIITGGLHLDGLADSADAWHGGRGDSLRMLAIMKDPHCGPAAVVWVVLVLLMKYGALVAILTNNLIAVLFLVPCLARAAVVVLMMTTPYVRAGGLGSALVEHKSNARLVIVLAFTTLLVVATFHVAGFIVLGVSAVSLLILRRLMLRNIGGTTGDTAGALIELTEAAVLVAAAAA